MATVLVVDDDPAILDLLIELVIQAGHIAIRASNGQEAWSLAQQHKPALIMSDLMMPVLDGYALLAAVRADPQIGDTMVVLISASIPRSSIIPGSGMALMSKPVDLAHIESFLAAL